ncbi:cheY-homologous receiver domain [Teratosphaeria destructans]|uniref:histidine kinase n=1 Tax=Teratosphaeria destructans TaxID=418781 RepID=A0A9W7SM71_9PEZI|nr:cheY-homologous receiver domain [Teratosphaeria destructans]
MRINITTQLGLLILLSSLIGLAVVSVATWVANHNFVLNIRSERLSMAASLKAAQLTSDLNLMQTAANFISTRVLIQRALQNYTQDGVDSGTLWAAAETDMADAISGSGSLGQELLLQTMVFPVNDQGPLGPYAVMNTTSTNFNANTSTHIRLPYDCPDTHTPVYLGDDQCGHLNLGYPPALYPNLTYLSAYYNNTFSQSEAMYDDDVLKARASPLLIGPWAVNDSLYVVSMTMPIVDNAGAVDVLGWLTAVMDARLVQEVINMTQGLDFGRWATSVTNRFAPGVLYTDNHGTAQDNVNVSYIMPLGVSDTKRHPDKVTGTANLPFRISTYPAVQKAFEQDNHNADNDGALISTHNEHKSAVSVGYALVNSSMVDWAVIVEQAKGEVWQPINHLRDILLACVFATAALMAILAFPLAYGFSLPIRRLREATRKSIEPSGSNPSRSSFDSFPMSRDGADDDVVEDQQREAEEGIAGATSSTLAHKEGFMTTNAVVRWRERRREEREVRREARRRHQFKIPARVKERRSCLKDELTDLTSTFNEMSDELMMQYERLEERVQQRTAELELSKKAAEAANESKTLFIANISHELKTPLNGILGMCAVCMQEDDPTRLKRSLGIIYKSGDLLLNLLTDLLTFSKNQVGQHLSLDEKEFRLRDVSTQLLAIFDKQAKDGNINLQVQFEGVPDAAQPASKTEFGPAGTGRIKDMILWGDTHRILQVLINLVSNALKFTPAGGSVTIIIRCLPELPDVGSRKASLTSRRSRQPSSRLKANSDASLAMGMLDTANTINPMDKPHALASFSVHERTATPPPGKYLDFEFEVRDTGPGISETLQHKIFEPFVQGDLGLSKKYGGTGLGLSICSQLASLMKGTIGVTSKVGEGSTFTMQIPIRLTQSRADSTASSGVDLAGAASGKDPKRSLDEPGNERAGRARSRGNRHSSNAGAGEEPGSGNVPPNSTSSATVTATPAGADSQPRLVGLSQPFFAASQPMESPGSRPGAMQTITDQASRSGGKIRVLVAEDNKVNQEVVLRMLKLEDIYDVTVAKDGQEALDRVKESMEEHRTDPQSPGPYNLIFMDVQMPTMDGIMSTKLIRQVGFQAPIVALTAFSEESNIRDCMESGMNYFLSKPIRRPQLKKVLKEYCAPIPEEEGEEVEGVVMKPRPGPANGGGDGIGAGGHPTVVMVDNGGGGGGGGERRRRRGSGGEVEDFDGSRPVSPLSAA